MGKQILATLGLLLLTVPQGFAHAILLTAVPAANQSVRGPDVDIHLEFNCRVERTRSRLSLAVPNRGIRSLPVRQSGPEILYSHIARVAPGEYRLQWQVRTSDGQITRGEVPFRVE